MINMLSRRGAIQNLIATGATGVSPTAAAQTALAAGPSDSVSSDLSAANVKTFGAIGDGVADDTAAIQAAIDDCFGSAERAHSGAKAYLNKPLYFPQGTYKTTAPLVLTNVRGGHIFGAGRFATTIRNVAGTSVLQTNGFEFNRVELLRLSAAGNSANVLDLDWTNGGGTALQSNTFADIRFDGGAIGANIGKSGYMGSESLFLNCFFGPHAVAGLRTSNFNALQNTLMGGNIQSCPVGIWVHMGSVSVYNTGFQICKTFDIVVDNSANDTMVVCGSRSESQNFIQLRNGITTQVVACSHLNSINGVFADVGGCQVTIDCCISLSGVVKGFGAIRTLNSSFGRSDWIDTATLQWGQNEVQSCYIGGTRNSGFEKARFISSKIMTSAGSQWPAQRRSMTIEPGPRKTKVALAPGTRVHKVTVILEKAGTAGALRVGDESNPDRYFNTADLVEKATVSSITEVRYDSADTLIVESLLSEGSSASVAIDFSIEC